ncbi:DUF6048 family protein [Ochrovirga pacifica]|uniref:DUF6048 family protein n=1 Tax=Ochrovirga pacifica TaxID=1042376 RepID=UPI0002559B3A|nr:DUF6048 family protein [Ochrovirga pacifica]
MFKYITSLFCVFFSLTLTAQNNTPTKALTTSETLSKVAEKSVIETDSLSPFYNPKTYGLRIGFDVIKPVYTFTKDYIKAFEIVADYRLKTNLFVAGELGYTQKEISQDQFDHTVEGSYLKAGINYNLFTNWLDMDNELYLGARYGFATFTNTLESYTIYQYGDFFEPKEVRTPIAYKNLNAHWVEFVAGIKVEIFSNFYLGFMASVSKLISTKTGTNFDNTYAPGMGGISKNGSGANINYTLSYRIPLYKK